MSIVVATRSGLVIGPGGVKYRLARGRTLGDSRHDLVRANPELFAPYHIELSVGEPEHTGGNLAEGETSAAHAFELTEARDTAERYREQLAAIAEGLYARGLVPADLDTEREGWLADLVLATIDGGPEASRAAAADPSPSAAEPDSLPAARKRAPRPRPATAE